MYDHFCTFPTSGVIITYHVLLDTKYAYKMYDVRLVFAMHTDFQGDWYNSTKNSVLSLHIRCCCYMKSLLLTSIWIEYIKSDMSWYNMCIWNSVFSSSPNSLTLLCYPQFKKFQNELIWILLELSFGSRFVLFFFLLGRRVVWVTACSEGEGWYLSQGGSKKV